MRPKLLTSWLPSRKTRRAERQRLGVELLEDRTMPTPLPPDLVVGRTLSAYATPDVQNHTLSVTYTVYNEQAEDISGLLLTATLQPAVTFATSSVPPDRNGQELAWSLGTLPGYGRASVTVTVTLPPAPPLQIDGGAHAFGTLNAGMVSADTPAAALVNRPIPADQLASTPDANTSDPFVQEQAAKLRYDPQVIFDYLNTDIGYESYTGSLRGARGTLWSAAGNSLDEASLGVALFRASGIPARYAHGTLSDALSKQLILSMFPPVFQPVGYITPGTTTADPANDPQLLSETRDHYWVQFDSTGTGFVDADSSGLPGGWIGTPFTTVSDTLTEVADAQRQKVEVALDAETYSQASAIFAFGSGLSTRTVLDHTFNAVDLVGRPLSVGHFVNTSSAGALFSTTTNTYSPYLRLGDLARPVEQDTLLRGNDYQEVDTSFPFGTQVLTGLTLRVRLTRPGAPDESYERVLLDRIGFAVRQNGGRPDVSFDGRPASDPTDFYTIRIDSVTPPASAFVTESDDLRAIKQRSVDLEPQLNAINLSAPTPADQSVLQQALELVRQGTAAYTNLVGTMLARGVDATRPDFDQVELVKAYFDSPRVTIISSRVIPGQAGATATRAVAVDLRKDDIRAVAYPGQATRVTTVFQQQWGLLEGIAEQQVFTVLPPNPTGQHTTTVPVGAAAVFLAAQQQGVPLVRIDATNLPALDGLAISAEAKARITQAVTNGLTVLVPAAGVQVGGATQLAWFESDPATGQTTAVSEDGGHQGAVEWTILGVAAVLSGALVFAILSSPDPPPLPFIAHPEDEETKSMEDAVRSIYTNLKLVARGVNDIVHNAGPPPKDPPIGLLLYSADVPSERPTSTASQDVAVTATRPGGGAQVVQVTTPTASFTADQNTAVTIPAAVETNLADTYTVTAEAPRGWAVVVDAAGRVAVTPAAGLQGGSYPVRITAVSHSRPDLAAQTTVAVTVTPTTPGVTLAVDHDPVFTVPYLGAQLPTAFRAAFDNLGPAADTYTLLAANPPTGFTVLTSATSVTVPGGKTGIVGLYLQPTAGTPLPAPGTVLTFDVTVASTANPAITQTRTVSFTVPEVHAVTITGTPASLATTPGQSVPATITLTSVGNVAETVALAATASTGLTITGLPPSVSLALGQTVSLPVTAAVAGTVPLNSTLSGTITATLAPADSPLTQQVELQVRVVVPGADAIAAASTAATDLGNADLAGRLGDLSTALTDLVQDPTSDVFKGQALAALDSVVRQLGADPLLVGFGTDLATTRSALAPASTATAVQAAVTDVGTALDTLAAALSGLAGHRFELSLLTNTQVIQPQTPASFQLVLRNTGTRTTTYTFAFDNLPAGFTGTFSQPSITLAPGEVTPALGIASVFATVTPQSTTELAPTNVVIRVTAQEAPGVTQTAVAALTARAEVVSVVAVTTDPPFTNPGPDVAVSARLLNAVNRVRAARASFEVRNAANAVVFTSPTTDVALSVLDSLTTVTLGSFPTAGLALGQYTIRVTLTETDGTPIPGATGEGSLLVGAPVTAALSVGPQVQPPGTGTVHTALQIDARTALVPPLSLVGVGAASDAKGVALLGHLAYVARSSGISIFDVTDPTNPVFVRTFGMAASNLKIRGDELVALDGAATGGAKLSIYSLAADPANPTLLGSTPTLPYSGLFGLLLTDTHAYVTALQFLFVGGDIIAQSGDLLSIDITNPAAPFLADVLVNTFGTNADGVGVAGGVDQSGGPFNVFDVAQVDANTLYIATTTSTGGDPNVGVGRVRVVDISNPAAMTVIESGELQIPGTVQITGLAVDGNRAFLVGSTGGWTEGDISRGLSGTTVIASLDITDHRSPRLLDVQTLSRRSRGLGGTFERVGTDLYAYADLGDPDDPHLFLLNTKNPLNLSTRGLDLGSSPTGLLLGLSAANGFIYGADAGGLKVFAIGASDPVAVTAQVQVPKGTGVAVVPGSFNLAPTSIVSGPDFDTLVWNLTMDDNTPTRTLTWDSALTGLRPGESRKVTLDTTVAFTALGTPGQVALPAQEVAAEQILSLDPATRTVRPGSPAAFTLTIANPTGTAVTYALAIKGVPASWSDLPSSVSAPAGGRVDVPFTLTSAALAALGDYGFVVTADSAGAAGSVIGDVVLAGAPVAVDPQSHGVVVGLAPAAASAGPGTSAVYVVRVTNTGSATTTFALGVTGVPAGVAASFDTPSVEVPPGAGNFREVVLTLTPAPGTSAGAVPFTVTATSPQAAGSTTGTITALAAGVAVALDRPAGAPGDLFRLTVTNTGTATDTFDLALAGTAALVADLGTAAVTLGPGESQVVSITTRAAGFAGFAVPGGMNLTVVARSQTNPAVTGAGTVSLQVGATAGLIAGFDPAAQQLPAAGTAEFVLSVENTGNTEDADTATITGTSGPVTATLIGLDGLPTQTIPIFRLPGLSSASVRVRVTLSGGDTGSVTVLVRSLSDPTRTASATATVTTSIVLPPPVVPPVVPPIVPPVVPPVPPPPPVGPVTPIVLLSSDRPTAFAGDPVTLTAVVQSPSGGTPTGSVTFQDGGQVLGSSGLVNGTATLTVRGLAPGAHTLTATYGGDAGFTPAASTPVAQAVLVGRRGHGQIYAIGAGPGGGPRVQVFDAATNTKRFDFFAYDPGLRGGVSVATGDVTGDGIEDIVTGAGVGGGPVVNVFDGQTGTLVASFFAYDPTFRGGVWVSTGDVDGDGVDEIVTGPGPGGGPAVVVWRLLGGTPAVTATFDAFEDTFRGGVTVACGVNPDGRAVIAAGSGAGMSPRVRIFDARTGAAVADQVVFEPGFTGGVYLASGDVLGTGAGPQFLVGPGPGGGPRLVVLRTDGSTAAEAFAGVDTLRNGLTVGALDQPDGSAAVIVGDGDGALRGELSGGSLEGLAPVGLFEDGFTGGVFIG
jgi:transglutaminase-like putative cysteine protease/uncharacterized membrane protein